LAAVRNAQNTFICYLVAQISADTDDKATTIVDSGIADLETFVDFESSDIVTLCTILRRPGGSTNVDGQDVPNRGVSITTVYEMCLKLCAYAANYYNVVQRPIDSTSMVLARIKHLKDLK